MKNHNDFIAELIAGGWATNAVKALSTMTAGGVAPEGRGHPVLNRVVEAIYDQPYEGLLPNLTGGIPIPAPREPVVPEVRPTTFALGAASKQKLTKLFPQMARVAERAITLSAVDFTVFETERTRQRQQELVNTGKSRTMSSMHLIQQDGFAHAMDLVHWLDGKPSWESWEAYAEIAFAVDQAATMLGCADRIRWGGAWDRVLSDFGGSAKLYIAEVEAYKSRHAGKDFIDGPHFEWRA